MPTTTPTADALAAALAILAPAALAPAPEATTTTPREKPETWENRHATELAAAIRSGSLARQRDAAYRAAPCAFQTELFPAGQLDLFATL